MPLTLIKEDGTGLSTANTYASRADGDAYAEARLRSTAWTGASNADKDASLVMATRIIDQEFQFNGGKVISTQALQWPRVECPDPDDLGGTAVLSNQFISGPFLDPTIVPRPVIDATCELALQLLIGERTGDSQGQGVKRIELAGAIEIEFDGKASPLVVTRDVINMLSKYGRPIGAGSGAVKLQRT